ncbi:SAM-dependent methyltransferase [Marinicella gelatinilytica]|uniref:SAM-dependent methyltransferase n=1 Tax=Marinicella gelatinilytica TaxID=2996017 RepID=UPI002260AE1F|nr:class I SAM-dependent methyltransferase [Marinicella gelatinilytica]MCX7545622.1 class I SAM-dependent methyltransferase [Marinicella gelatinilytica]
MSWDDRYNDEGYFYGVAPNDFLAAEYQAIPLGRVLCLAEGEGRNAVFLAEQGYQVTAVDASKVGLEKAKKLARDRGVEITTVQADLAEYQIEASSWHGIVSIFCHLPPKLRQRVHRAVADGLVLGGALVLEAYTPAQLNNNTGGPPSAELMMDAAMLKADFKALDIVHLAELKRDVIEGRGHTGAADVVQLLATKP